MAMISKSDGKFVLSASDITSSAKCEFGWLRVADVKLGRIEALDVEVDAMLDRTARLGDTHEARQLDLLQTTHHEVLEMARPKPYNRSTLSTAATETVSHLNRGVDVLAQATFFDGGFGGMADFLIKDPNGRYEVWDAKLARHAKVEALLQIAAYADQLDRVGVARSPIGFLLLGDGRSFAQDLTEIIPVYRQRRANLESVLSNHIADGNSAEWNDERYSFCGTCDHCSAEIEAHRDLLLVAGMRKTQRLKLREAGIASIDELTVSMSAPAGMNPSTYEALRAQASLQIEPTNLGILAFEIIDPSVIQALPRPSPGDIFFDFEGDPLWSDASGTDWGLEYLFGVIEPEGDGKFRPWWAHNRDQENSALIAFLDYVTARRNTHPDMHVYHYAPYEVTALKRLVGRFGTHEDVLDDLLRSGIFIDLYQTVRQSLRAGTRSYSIKKLEPLYMGDELRTGLDNAADSIVEYQKYTDQILSNDPAAATTLAGIEDYNKYDCLSTWRLRDWLRNQVSDVDMNLVTPPSAPEDDRTSKAQDSIDEITPLMDALLAHAGDPENRSADEQAAAMVAASVGFYRREHKPFWWAFFDRLTAWPGDWLEPRDSLHATRVEIVEDWSKVGNKSIARTLRFVGQLELASNLTVGTGVTGIYEDIPAGLFPPEAGGRCVGGGATIEEVDISSDGHDVLIVRERVKKGVAPWTQLPIGLCVPSPIPTGSIEATLLDLARDVCTSLPSWPASPGLDLLRRLPPRLTRGDLATVDVAPEDAIHDSLLALDHSYLAVQGPPGTGKTYVGSRVIKHLVDRGWRIGVVAQSHAIVENFFNGAIAAGLSPDLIAKPRSPEDSPWADLNGAKLRAFIDENEAGCLVGGTAWTFSSRTAVGAHQLDLLVIDEAGQFSLANTLAVSTAAQRLLLLGDPQQLPQVSHGTHPEPVDTSALEWLADGNETMPTDRGYFLERTWRMHSDLTASVSRHSYAGRLRSEVSITGARELTGVAPGVHAVEVSHSGNDVQSIEEAKAVVDLVRGLQRQKWRDSAEAVPRSMTPADVLVVAPYNAQVALLRRKLATAGFGDTRVGTVDKFQGQEAPVVIVSMTASSADDVPRGMDFLLNRNRLNVAVSRGQWAAYIVRSSTLTEFLPRSPHGLCELGAFLGLVEKSGRNGNEPMTDSDQVNP